MYPSKLPPPPKLPTLPTEEDMAFALAILDLKADHDTQRRLRATRSTYKPRRK